MSHSLSKFASAVCVLLLAGCHPARRLSEKVDPDLAEKIAKIRAIDNHAHPVAASAGDTEYDALPVDNMEPSTDPLRTRPETLVVLPAWKSLFSYGFNDRKPEHLKDLEGLKAAIRQREGIQYPAMVLDKSGIEIMLANRVALGAGLKNDRFRWVAFADALMLPLDTAPLRITPDRKTFFELEAKLLDRYRTESALNELPKSLPDYLKLVVTATLERHRKGGAVAEKFEAAYLRPLDFSDAPEEAEAARIYASGKSSVAEYGRLQNHLFRYIAKECGRLGMAVHFHTGSGGGGYFSVAGSNPMLMEPLFNDPSLRKTNFVIVHGGWPFDREVAALLAKPNVYADFSDQNWIRYPQSVAEMLRGWLEYAPDKILFGTDAYPNSPDMGWEEEAWVTTQDARESLGRALTAMIHDGEINQEQALRMARQVLRENAASLYHLR